MTTIRRLLACLALATTLGLAAGTTVSVVGGTAAYAQNGTKGAPNPNG